MFELFSEYQDKADACFAKAKQITDPYIKAFMENAGVGYLYKESRAKGRDPMLFMNKPYRADGNYIGVTSGVPDPDDYYGLDAITVYGYDEENKCSYFDYWDDEGKRCHGLLKNYDFLFDIN